MTEGVSGWTALGYGWCGQVGMTWMVIGYYRLMGGVGQRGDQKVDDRGRFAQSVGKDLG